MQSIQKLYTRTFQLGEKIGTQLIHFPEPLLVYGADSLYRIPKLLKEKNIASLLIVTGNTVSKSNEFAEMVRKIEEAGIKDTIFKNVPQNPTTACVEKASEIYNSTGCGAIIAYGGGSPIDCAKAVAAVVSNHKTVKQLEGYFHVKKKLPLLIAVPTTSGSGSEATAVAVITDENLHQKVFITDTKLIPAIAVIDPKLTVSLPKSLTAATGMDALTHAVEAYVGSINTEFTNKNSQKAVRLIMDNLEAAYDDGSNLEARRNMALASYCAGLAFTRAFVGYVHAIAHALGGLYGCSHGLMNAIILPYVLDFYGDRIDSKLAQLSIACHFGKEGDDRKNLALTFKNKIRSMNAHMGIPQKVQELKKEDIPLLAQRILKEANPFYPVPKLMDNADCIKILRELIV